MFRPTRRFWILATVVMAAMMSGASQADAWWGYYQPVYLGGCGYGCYSPCYYTSCYTPCYTSCYTPCYVSGCTIGCDPCGDSCGWYLGYRPGPIRRLLFGPYRWYYGGGYCCWSSCYDPCCPTTTTIGTETLAPAVKTPTRAQRQPEVPSLEPEDVPSTVPTTPTVPDTPDLPAIPSAPLTPPSTPLIPDVTTPGLPLDDPATPLPFDLPSAPTPAEPPTPTIPGTPAVPTPPTITPSPPFGGSAPATSDGSALLTVTVPLGTEVFINGKPTTSTGMERQYVSKGLDPNLVYKYEVVAYVSCERTEGFHPPEVVVVEHKKIPLKREVYLRAGDHERLAFSINVTTHNETATVPRMVPRRDEFGNVLLDENGQQIMDPSRYRDPVTRQWVDETEEQPTGRYMKTVVDDDLNKIYTRLTQARLEKVVKEGLQPGPRPADWTGEWLAPPAQAGI